MYIFGAPIESEGPGMVSSLFVKSPAGAHSSRRLDKMHLNFIFTYIQNMG